MTAPKIASLVCGVAVLAIAAFATQLDPTMRMALVALGGFLCGFPLTPPGASKAAGAAALLFVLGVSPALSSCSSATPEARGAEAAQLTRLGFSVLVVTHNELADLHFGLAQAVQTPEQAQIAAPLLRRMLEGLDRTHALLEKARPYVAAGKDEAEVRVFLRDGLAELENLLPLLGALGKAPPPQVLEALGYLRGFLGGAS